VCLLTTHSYLKSTPYTPSYQSETTTDLLLSLVLVLKATKHTNLLGTLDTASFGGTCPTVGVVGGYPQGGSHSMLSSQYGMGSINVLEWGVVTVDGRHLVATPEKNDDLYWALSGGGAGTYAVVLSMTARLHKDIIVSGTTISFNDSAVGNDQYWDAVAAWHTLLPPFLDAGHSFMYAVGANQFTAYGTMPGADLNAINVFLQPFLDD
jgi:FAD/FMN-containing dehydrogenase